MRIAAFGTYQSDTHPRARVLIEGLRERGHEVIEINAPLGLSTAERVAMLRQPWRLPVLAGRLLQRWIRLFVEGRRARPEVDAVLVGYMGHFDIHLARLTFPKLPLVLDHLIFAAGTATDRGTGPGLRMMLLGWVDRAALRQADVIVVDTEEHRAGSQQGSGQGCGLSGGR